MTKTRSGGFFIAWRKSMTQTSRLVIELDSRDAEKKAADVRVALDELENAGLRVKPAMDKASDGLDKLSDSGRKAETSVGRTGKAWTETANVIGRDAQKATKDIQALNTAQAAFTDTSLTSFHKLYGGASALEAGMFSLGNAIQNGTFVDSLKSTQEAKAWLASLNATTKESSAAFLDAGQKLTHLSNGMKGLGAWSGSGLPVFAQVSKKGAEAAAGLSKFDDSLAHTGISAKQTAAALRGVPAQFTDIAVSLQAGQNPLQVFLQQGGQLKDMFGGAGPAARALGGYVLGLVNPFTVAAAAVGVLGLAYKQGSDEATAFNNALILSGNAAGTTSEQLAGSARNVSRAVGTVGAAAEVLSQLAASGKIPAASFDAIAIAALKMQEATGKASSETVAEFNKLAGDPVKASKSLNESLNYLTAAQYAQIEAMQRSGDQAGAASLAEQAYADALTTRANKIHDSLGYVESAWHAVKSAAKGAWDAFLDIGREDTFEQKLNKLKSKLEDVRNAGTPTMFSDNPDMMALSGGEAGVQKEITDLLVQQEESRRRSAALAKQAADNKAGIAAVEALNTSLDGTASRQDKLAKRYKEIDDQVKKAAASGVAYSQQQIDQLRKAAEEQFKEPKTPKPKSYTEDAGIKLLDSARQAYAVLLQQNAALDGQGIAVQRVGAQAQALIKWEQQLADIKGKSTLTADQKSLLASQDLITAQLKKNAALEQEAELQKGIKQANEDQVKLLTLTGQLHEANRLKSSLDDAAQMAEYERQGNTEAAKRLETLIKIRDVNLKAAQKPGTIEGVSKAPAPTGLDASVGGADSEIIRLNTEAEQLDKWRATELEKQKAYLDLKAINEETYAARVDNINNQAAENRAKIEQAKNTAIINQSSSFFGIMATLSQSGNKKLAAIGKAAAMAQATIDGYLAIQKALAAFPPPFNFIAAGVVGVATAANVSRIAGIGYSGGGYTGAGGVNEYAGDVHKGEVVWSQADIRKAGGVATVEALRKGNVSAGRSSSGGSGSTAMASNGVPVKERQTIVNLHEDASRAGQVSRRQLGEQDVIDICVANIRSERELHQVNQEKYGLKSQGA